MRFRWEEFTANCLMCKRNLTLLWAHFLSSYSTYLYSNMILLISSFFVLLNLQYNTTTFCLFPLSLCSSALFIYLLSISSGCTAIMVVDCLFFCLLFVMWYFIVLIKKKKEGSHRNSHPNPRSLTNRFKPSTQKKINAFFFLFADSS